MKKLFPVLLLALICGGCAEVKSPRQAFLSSVGKDSTNYIEIYEVSIESIEKSQNSINRVVTNLIYNIGEDLEKCGPTNCQCALVNERLARIQKGSRWYYSEQVKQLGELEKFYNPKTDVIFYYNYAGRDFGYVVVVGNKIKKKLVLETAAGTPP